MTKHQYLRILTKRGLLVFGGPPKIGKSDFLISWLVHMAAGVPFLGMVQVSL
nr:AAA family ATPase [Wolbachia endosymbiont of Atemnus politus]